MGDAVVNSASPIKSNHRVCAAAGSIELVVVQIADVEVVRARCALDLSRPSPDPPQTLPRPSPGPSYIVSCTLEVLQLQRNP